VEVFALLILTNLKDHGVQAFSYPADRPVLIREIGALVEVIGVRENLLHFLKADPALGFARSLLLFRASNRNRMMV
jgi:hypothetical protein